MAEVFNERLFAEHKQVIVLADVIAVTATMGNVNDFDIDGDDDMTLRSGRKLFRDIDDRILGGVCAGMAHYFNIEPKWMRLLAIVFVLFGGIGLPVYIILWIIMPAASTRTDKMAMKGEQFNIQSFKKNFDEEVKGLKGGFHRAHNEVRPAIYQIGKLIETLAKLFVKFIVAIVAFLGILTMIVLFIALIIFLGYWNSNELNTFPFTIVNPAYKSVLALSAFIVVFIPLAALVLFAVRILVARIAVSRTVYFAMLIVWIVGLLLGTFHGSKIASEFNEEAEFSVTTPLAQSPVYYLKINHLVFLTREDSVRYKIDGTNFKGKVISRNNDFDEPTSVRIRIVKGDVGKPTLVQEFSAKGSNFEEALSTARRVNHGFIQQDSLLIFDHKTHLQKGELWRDQSVNLILTIPENTRVMIENPVNPYLTGYNVWECQPENAASDFISRWKMTNAGLKCENDSLNIRKDTISANSGN